jgi:2-polyprenyl-3-methyl-5-hydroxy-6-metoxy-1,4-benzoquinol methylase
MMAGGGGPGDGGHGGLGRRIRAIWLKTCFRTINETLRGADGDVYLKVHRWLRRAYLTRDPWNLSSEATRFESTNRIILENLPPLETLLELGCGEGHQSEYLLRTCRRFRGIDVCSAAVDRARTRIPKGEFAVEDFERTALRSGGRYSLVTACEMLYYLQDIPSAINRMAELGEWCLITFFKPRASQLERHLKPLRHARRDVISFGRKEWIAVWWRTDTGSKNRFP